MAKLDTSTCPKCGAPLEIRRDTTEITCPYCGNVAIVDHGEVRAPEPPPRTTAGTPLRPAAIAIVPAILGVAIALGAALSARHHAASSSASGGGGTALGGLFSSERLSFDDSPMLADVDGDGTPDVVGHCRTNDGGSESHFLAAYAGATGKPLWRSPPGPKETFAGMRALVGSYIVNVDELGKVQAFHLSNGTPAWSGLLGEKAKWFCADGSSAIIEASDESYTRFDLATGKKATLPATGRKRPSCAPVYASPRTGETPTFRLIDWPEFAANGLPELHATPGMSAHRALVPVAHGPGPSFLLGSKDKGTSVAMVAAVEGGKVTWKDVVPGVDALTTDVNVTTILAAAGDGRVVIPYGLRNEKGVRMACFDAKSGTRLWDVQVHGASNVETGITVEAGRVYYTSWTALYVLSLADGKRLFTIGYDF
ncbi:MAG TPA: PQQ-binding-like beta-propeller repeat protein [Polyangiaceae bacterium]|nr:PQQ-binding-like beta-propeller repeat protein [Polyangiaceae bacterium]